MKYIAVLDFNTGEVHIYKIRKELDSRQIKPLLYNLGFVDGYYEYMTSMNPIKIYNHESERVL